MDAIKKEAMPCPKCRRMHTRGEFRNWPEGAVVYDFWEGPMIGTYRGREDGYILVEYRTADLPERCRGTGETTILKHETLPDKGKVYSAPADVECECGLALRAVTPLFATDPYGWHWGIKPDDRVLRKEVITKQTA